MTVKILGVIDEDPFDPRTWSSISRFFFGALDAQNCLCDAIAATPLTGIQAFYKVLSVQNNLEKWKFRYHLNTGYFNEMTRVASNKIRRLNPESYDAILQIGAWYNLTSAANGKPVVSYHDGNLATRLASPYGYPAINRKYIRKALDYERSLYMDLDFIFPMSKWLADSFVKDFGISPDKIFPVGAGINLPRIKEPKDKDEDRPIILFVGKDFRRKGGYILLEAFNLVRKIIRNAELVIVGPQLENQPDGVTCAGYIDKHSDTGLDKLLDLYASSSIYVMPSLYEPFGIVFAEAMAHRLPCIGTNNCAMPEIIDHGKNGFLVEANNSHELADRIIELLGDKPLRNEMGESAYSKYENNYRWDLVVSKITSVIEDITR